MDSETREMLEEILAHSRQQTELIQEAVERFRTMGESLESSPFMRSLMKMMGGK